MFYPTLGRIGHSLLDPKFLPSCYSTVLLVMLHYRVMLPLPCLLPFGTPYWVIFIPSTIRFFPLVTIMYCSRHSALIKFLNQ